MAAHPLDSTRRIATRLAKGGLYVSAMSATVYASNAAMLACVMRTKYVSNEARQVVQPIFWHITRALTAFELAPAWALLLTSEFMRKILYGGTPSSR